MRVRIVSGAEGGTARSPGRARSRSPDCVPARRSSRRTTLPRRATLLARDGSVLAEGAATGAGTRSSPLGASASAVVGEVGPIPQLAPHRAGSQGVPERRGRRHERPGAGAGRPPARHARRRAAGRGSSGCSPALARRRARAARCARASPRRCSAPRWKRSAASSAASSRCSRPPARSWRSPGIGLDSVQPPGSTFKMVTLTRRARQPTWPRRAATFPYATYATLDGVKLSNANGEECGGSLALAFAVSCNSVFAPLGVKLGRRAWWRRPNASASTTRRASRAPPKARCRPPSQHPGRTRRRLDGDRPGPGAGERAADGDRGGDDRRRRAPSAADVHARQAPRRRERATSASVARTVRRLMIGVVRNGTGTSAAIPGRDRRRQDRHSRTEDPVQLGSAEAEEVAGESEAQARASCGWRADSEAEQHRRLVRRLRARACTRASSSACCWSKTAPAATPPRPWRGRCSRRDCSAEPLDVRASAELDVELGRGRLRPRRRDRRCRSSAGGCPARRSGS